MRLISALATIAYRDFTKLMRDRTRILTSFIFPVLFIGVLGSSMQSSVFDAVGFDYLTFVFTGVLGQTLFQSTAAGIISLIEDRTNDFSQEIFVSPISRYTIIVGKILGETSVAMFQALGIVVFGLLVGVEFSLQTFISVFPFAIIACFLGGAFGILVLSNLKTERTANQVFPFIIFPQFFLAGVFNPIDQLPPVLNILSLISPMRYAIDLVRGIYYWGTPDYSLVVLKSPMENIIIITILSTIFLVIGTALFVKGERTR